MAQDTASNARSKVQDTVSDAKSMAQDTASDVRKNVNGTISNVASKVQDTADSWGGQDQGFCEVNALTRNKLVVRKRRFGAGKPWIQ
ncbi:unnamed protein product [Peronospora farinosa]|uniref:CsbD-like domain-containing protein n=1 Tax=Peronospora farinosa TaxID=134698 RepID=A0ABN8C3W4_9STRA|nr:unnamed protein product [Peronospora farinosa]